MAEVEEGMVEKKKRKLGGAKTMPFILANEACDKFAAVGFHANMITYLTQQLHMPLVQASNTLTNFSGTSSLTPIIGALIADSFAGRFWTITIGSIIYQLGMISLTVSAVLPALRPPPCHPGQPCEHATSTQLFVLYASLLLTALGSGGIRPCVVAFGADQFELGHGPRAASKRGWNFFNLYYFCMGLAILTALTLVVYIQDDVGWGWGLGLPTIFMGLSVVAFIIGYPLYVQFKPAGSPLTRLAQVVVAAFRKRKVAAPADPSKLYENKELDAPISTTGRLLHTNELKFFDKAAIPTDGDHPSGDRPNLWRLSTVHRVEELKSVLRMLPIWSTGVLLAAASAHNHSFVIQQARSMDRHLSPSFTIPPATMSIFTTLSMLLSLALYDRLLLPLTRGRFTYLHRMWVGLAISVLATAVAAEYFEVSLVLHQVETRRRRAAAAAATMSVFWLVPQYALHGVAEAFMSVGHLEFLYDQAPESMRSSAAALFWMASSIGNYVSTLLVTVVHDYTKGRGHDWLQDNINKGRLDCYYRLVTCLQVVNLVYYTVCVRFYTYKPLETAVEVEKMVVGDGRFVQVDEGDGRSERVVVGGRHNQREGV
ncbi:putative nitrite transporter [Acorus gramineus]|uniref:Nitrite transporter n=1 Tax=Acorus gramineus TaxID=55184 RepID=A0AAV9BPV2_ACOGR|nr:putative nitrite transporter [Acorus gramineus]